jgi:hypothetical protein
VDYAGGSQPRYGYGRPPHIELWSLLDARRDEYASILKSFIQFKAPLERIPLQPSDDPKTPYWMNVYLTGLDPVSLYALARLRNPSMYVEIGSGNSTKWLRRAVDDHGLRTRIISIDPRPRAEIDALCHEVRREPLEETDLAVFGRLGAGDILFVDGSHRVFMNSDVATVFLDVLPRLKSGVLVYIDDIFLPLDYPPDWVPRYYSEQYLLAVLLLAGSSRYEVVLPCTFVTNDPELSRVLDPLWNGGPLAGMTARGGNGFWLRVR